MFKEQGDYIMKYFTSFFLLSTDVINFVDDKNDWICHVFFETE